MNNEQNNDAKIDTFITIFSSIRNIIGGFIVSWFCLFMFVKGADTFSKVVIIPFLICGLAVLITGFSHLFKGINMMKTAKSKEYGDFTKADETENKQEQIVKVEKIGVKLYVAGFALFWFGFLIVFDYFAIKSWNDGGTVLFFFSLIFWIAGIIFLKNNK